VSFGPTTEFPTPPDLIGFWQWDRVHCPRVITPLSEDTLLAAANEGFAQGLSDYSYPQRLRYRVINGYAYSTFEAVDPSEAVLAALRQEHRKRLRLEAGAIPRRWDEEWRPLIERQLRTLRETNYAALPDDELLATFANLLVDLRSRWHIHGLLLMAYVAVSEFDDLYRRLFAPAEPNEAYLLLHGVETKSLNASQGLWDVGTAVRQSPSLSALFTQYDGVELVRQLTAPETGRDFVVVLERHLDECGWRSDGIFELSEPSWREDLRIPLNAIRGQLGLPQSASPKERYLRATERREELLARRRNELEGRAEAVEFEERLAAAAHHVVIDEDHNFLIDQAGNTLLRLPVLELGRRLVGRGRIQQVDDVFMLRLHEIEANFGIFDLTATAAKRRAGLEHWKSISPPLSIGEPPIGGETDPFAASMAKMDGEPVGGSTGLSVIGLAGAPGVARGTTRVVRSLEDAADLQPGEVLVCEMTLPSWTFLFATAVAVVCDTGGALSHCAVVAREFGIPCVVGTGDGTRLLQSGLEVTVDGTRGIVTVDGS
jgi:rifampicin phosphotransferase